MALIRKRNKLRELRSSQGLSGYDLQLLSNINAQRIYLIERGIVAPNRFEKARIATVLKLSEAEIFPKEMRFSSEIEEEGRRRHENVCKDT